MSSHQSSALFTFSLRNAVINNVAGFLFTLSIGVYYLFTQPFGYVGMSVFSLVSLIPLVGAYRYSRRPITSAWFYDDHFRFRGRHGERVMTYTEIKKVSKVRSFPLLIPITQVHVFVKGSETPLMLAIVPKNKKLKLDLHSWLTQKIQQT